jgi:protein phosphatase
MHLIRLRHVAPRYSEGLCRRTIRPCPWSAPLLTRSVPLRWTSASRTDVGLIRRRNEDACVALPERGLWALADGMGGHAAGDFASDAVTRAVGQISTLSDLRERMNEVEARLQATNRALRDEAARRGVPCIGSTAVVLVATEARCGWLWAGDSRLYRYRVGKLTQLSQDHSEVQELVRLGWLTAEAAAHHPARHVLTRAIGAEDDLGVDRDTDEVLPGDVFLLCSDGLTNEVADEDIGTVLANADCAQACDRLVELALRHGGNDNVSVVVVRADA